MYGYDLQLVPVSLAGSNGPRGSLFSSSVSDTFGFSGAPRSASPSLGQTKGENIYREAKEEVAEFDSLVTRTARIANKTAREELIRDFGLTDPSNKDKAQYMRDATAYNIRQAESYTPVNTYIFEASGPAKNRPAKLEDYNNDFQEAVKYAEDTYGILPEPVVIERVVTVPGAAEGGGWVIPAVVGGGLAIGALALLGVFGK